MGEYNLGEARGRIVIDGSGAVAGVAAARQATSGLMGTLQNNQQTIRRTGVLLTGIGAAALAGFGTAVNAAADFEKELSAIKAVTGSSEEAMDDVREKALQLGRDTAYGAAEAANAMVNLGKAGLTTSDIVNGAADATVALAAAGDTDLANAASIAASSMAQFQLAAEDLPEVADILAGAANSADQTVSDLGESMKYAGPVAGALGVSLQDTAAIISVFAKNGIRGSQAGTTLRRIMSQLQPTTERAQEAFKELGFTAEDGSNAFYDAEGNLKSMGDVVGIMSGAFADLDSAQQQAYAEAIFGDRAMGAVLATVKGGPELFNQLNDAIDKTSAADVASERLNNLSGDITILKGTIETALISAGSPFQEFFRGIVQPITRAINAFASMDPQLQKFIIGGVAVAGVLATLSGAFLLILSLLPAISTGFGVMVGTVLPAIAPFLAVAAAVAALVAGFVIAYKRSETFRNAVDKVVGFLKGAAIATFKRVASFIQDVVAGAMEWLRETIESLRPQIENLVSSIAPMVAKFKEFMAIIIPIAQAIGGFLATAFQKLWTIARPILMFLVRMIGDTLRTAINGVVQVFQGAVAIISGILDVFIGLFTGNWSRMWEGIKSIASGVFNAIVGAIKTWLSVTVFKVVGAGIKGILAIFRGGWRAITGVFRGAINGIGSSVKGGMNFIRTTIQRVQNLIKNILQGAWNFIKSLIRNAVTAVKNRVVNTFQTIRLQISTIMSAIRNGISTVWNAIKAIIRGVVTGIKNTVVNIFKAIWRSITGTVNGIKNTIVRVWNLIVGALRGAASRARQAVVDGFRQLKDGAVRIANNLLDFVRQLPGRILRGLGNVGKLLFSAGEKILQGLVDGIKSIASKPVDAVKSVVGKVRDLLPFSPAKDGPLKTHPPDEAGATIGTMVADGILSSVRAAASAGRALAGVVQDAVTPAVASGALGAGAGYLPAAAAPQAASSSHGGITRRDLAAALSGGPLIHQEIHGASEEEVRRGTKTALRQIATEWDL